LHPWYKYRHAPFIAAPVSAAFILPFILGMTWRYCTTSQRLCFIMSQYSYTVNKLQTSFIFYYNYKIQMLFQLICGHCYFKYIIKRTIYGKICITPPINLQPMSALGPTALGMTLESQVDRRCDTDFAMYYSLYSIYISAKCNHQSAYQTTFHIHKKVRMCVIIHIFQTPLKTMNWGKI
jgi:hypothetical protein